MAFVRGVVNVTVVLQIPQFLIYFFACYAMGPTSQVYKHSARTRLNVFSKFHNCVAKLMLAEVAFRGLLGDFQSALTELGGLRSTMLRRRLADIFMKHGNSGLLTPDEIDTMAAMVFHQMDKDDSGEICCNEFIEACTDDGEISLQMMAHFFDDKKNVSRMRHLLDSTVTEKRHSEKLLRQSSRELSSERPVLDMIPEVTELGCCSEADPAVEKEVPHQQQTVDMKTKLEEQSCCSVVEPPFEKEVPQQQQTFYMKTEVAALSCCSVADHALEKDVKQPVSNEILEKEVSIPELVKRLQDLESRCEQSFRELKDAMANTPSYSQTPLSALSPHACSILSQLPTSSRGSATQASHVPLPTSILLRSLLLP